MSNNHRVNSILVSRTIKRAIRITIMADRFSPEAQGSQTPGGSPDQLASQAAGFLRAGQLDASYAAFSALATFESHSSIGHFGMGEVLLRKGYLDEAEVQFLTSLNADARNAESAYELGYIAEKRGDFHSSRRFYEMVLSKQPNHARARARLEDLQRKEEPLAVVPLSDSNTSSPTIERVSVPATYGIETSDDGEADAIYDALRGDESPATVSVLRLMDQTETGGYVRGRLIALLGRDLGRMIRVILVVTWVLLTIEMAIRLVEHVRLRSGESVTSIAHDRATVTTYGLLLGGLAVLFGFVYWTIWARSARFKIHHGRISMKSGVLTSRVEIVNMWNVHKVELIQAPLNRLSRDASILLHQVPQPGETTNVLKLTGFARIRESTELAHQLQLLSNGLRSHPMMKGLVQV